MYLYTVSLIAMTAGIDAHFEIHRHQPIRVHRSTPWYRLAKASEFASIGAAAGGKARQRSIVQHLHMDAMHGSAGLAPGNVTH